MKISDRIQTLSTPKSSSPVDKTKKIAEVQQNYYSFEFFPPKTS